MEVKAQFAKVSLSTTRMSLISSHIDAVRSLCFYQGPEILLASGGDDCTVKVWSIDPVTVLSNK